MVHVTTLSQSYYCPINNYCLPRPIEFASEHIDYLTRDKITSLYNTFKTDRPCYGGYSAAHSPPIIMRVRENQSQCTRIITSYLTVKSFVRHALCSTTGRCSRIKQSFVKFPLPENAIRGLFSHHKIKTTLEDSVRPGTGMKKRIDQRKRQKKRRENKIVC